MQILIVHSGHDLLAWRLATILQKLNQGERLDIDQLADEFDVHRRTIQRDLLERFAFLPLLKVEGCFAMDPAYLGRLSFKDIQRFAALAGLQGLFPQLDRDFFRELFDQRLQGTLIVHGYSYEDIRTRGDDFRALQSAIHEHRKIQFLYHKDTESKLAHVLPYRMINNSGVWYLCGVNEGKPKAYAFGKIASINVTPETFEPDAGIHAMLDQEDSIWLNTNKTEAVLTVAAAIAPYFRRRKLIPKQVIEKELEDGGLIISGRFAHPNQLIPIVRYWLPNIRIINPTNWQEELEASLQEYLSV